MKNSYKILIAVILSAGIFSCTNLDEHVYSGLMSANFYQKRSDVVKAVFRPYEHFFESVQRNLPMEEYPGDVMITPQMCDLKWWWDEGRWSDWHKHNFQDIAGSLVESNIGDVWTNTYTGIAQCNLVLDDIMRLDRAKFPDIDAQEWDSFECQLRAARAYAYLRLFNFFRNCPLVTSSASEENEKPERKMQVSPEVMYNFIESELLDCLNRLPAKVGAGGPGIYQGQFTKAAAAVLLVRLYLNTEVWMGYAAWDKCLAMCDRILNGEFGAYSLAEKWYEPFDWNNDECPEVIFGYPASYGTTSWHMQNDRRTIYGRSLPYNSMHYFDIESGGSRNPKWHLSPTYDNMPARRRFDGPDYGYKLGCPIQKFAKYSDSGDDSNDLRYRQYKNTSANTREGMFILEGYIEKGGTYAEVSNPAYRIYMRDQVGRFYGNAQNDPPTLAEGSASVSTLEFGDMNSGLCCIKYPFYSFNGGYYMESDYTDMRLTEVVYSKAECLYRQGNVSGAGALLNSVRKRNYRTFSNNIAYIGSDGGTVTLDDQEFIDEWMREFIFEGRRRTDLIRWGRFEEAWWDKAKDADTHCRIYPLSKSILSVNPYLKQNPGYPGIN